MVSYINANHMTEPAKTRIQDLPDYRPAEGGIAGASVEIAKIIFFIAIVLFLVSAIFGAFRGRGSAG